MAQAHGLSPEACALRVLEQGLSEQQRREQAAFLLQSWIDQGDAAEQKRTYEYLTQALDERRSDRKLFPPELRGVTW
jgi:hypothetical protein